MDTLPPLALTPADFQFNGTPLPEVRELGPSSGWLQWDLAVRLEAVTDAAKNICATL